MYIRKLQETILELDMNLIDNDITTTEIKSVIKFL